MNDIPFISRLFLDYDVLTKAFGQPKIQVFFRCYWEININNNIARIEGNISEEHNRNVKLWNVYGNNPDVINMISSKLSIIDK